MGADIILVREYLESLREKQELDEIFPLLLQAMDHQIITTARESEGQPQYGKDIISVGPDEDGMKWRYYFELKGHADRNITDQVFSKPDGIRDSLIAMKDAPFEDSSYEGFNKLPIKYVLVHTGILKSNTRRTFEGFITREFSDTNFERWDIYRLSELFSYHLFGEFLLTNPKNIILFKKTLVLIDTPDYDPAEFRQLIDELFTHTPDLQTRKFDKLIATIQLVCYILMHYSEEAGNLTPAKKGIAYCVLKTWHWILINQFEQNAKVLKAFRKLLVIHHNVLETYFRRTLQFSFVKDGLFNERGEFFESVGYPLRAMDYLGDMVYFFWQRKYLPHFDGQIDSGKRKRLEKKQKAILMKVVEENDGCCRALLDNHYIPIALSVIFVLNSSEVASEDLIRMHNYLIRLFENILLIKDVRKCFPEFRNNVESLIECFATNERPFDYTDSSSILIMVLFELLAVLSVDKDAHTELRVEFHEKINLQLPFPPSTQQNPDFELDFFKGNTYNKTVVQTSIELPATMEEMWVGMAADGANHSLTPRTDAAGFSFLKWLSCIYFKNDIYPSSWRGYCQMPGA